MTVETTDRVVRMLRKLQLLSDTQLEEVERNLAPRLATALALAQELIQRGWITAFQANRLLQGKEGELRLGSYLLVDRIGRGGMGEVFRARLPLMERSFAIKIIRPELLTQPETVSRFKQEIQAASRMDHPNVIRSTHADQVGHTYYLVMDYVEGKDLACLLRQRGQLPVGEACEYIRQAALGLQHIHERKLVHRDLKPSNLLFSSRDGVVKILDLGLSRLRSEAEDDARAISLTQEGVVMGTPDYLAPEQALDSHYVDIRADIYSLGCTLYHLLSGRPPFPGGSRTQKLLRHQQAEPEPLTQLLPELPDELALLVHKMLAKEPEDRYPNPAEVAAALQGFACPIALPQSIPAAVPVAKDGGGQLETGSYHLPEHETLVPPPLAPVPPEPATTPANVPRTKRRRLWIAAGAAAGCAVVLILVLLIAPWKDRPASAPTTSTEEPAAPPDTRPATPPDTRPTAAERPIAWHKETHDLLTRIMPAGVKSAPARDAYTRIVDALDRGEDHDVYIGSRLTRDHRPYVISLKNGKVLSRPLRDEEVKARKLDPGAIGSTDEEKPLALHGGQLVILEKPELQLRRDKSGSYRVEGRILCRGSVQQPLADAALLLRRRFHKGDDLHRLTKFQHLDLTQTPSGWLQVQAGLPTEQLLSPRAVGAIAEPRIEVLLIAFAFEPQPRLYEISNTCTLLIQGGQLVPDPNRAGGGNREVRTLVEQTLKDKDNSDLLQRVCSDLSLALDEHVSVRWGIGAAHTRSGQAHIFKVRNGKLSSEQLTDEQAQKLKIEQKDLRRGSGKGFRLRHQPLMTLSRPEFRVEKARGSVWLRGRVHCTPLHEQPLRHANLILRYYLAQDDPTEAPQHTVVIPLQSRERPSGWLELEGELAEGIPPGSRALLYVESYLSWPQPGFYRISNERPLTISAAP